MNNKGLTLVELLVVLLIIAMISAIAIINIISAIQKGRQKATMSDMRTISRALETYNIDFGFYPADGLTMDQLRETLVPFSSSVLPMHDAWGHLYTYATDGRSNYTIESYGKDGIDNENISYDTRFEYNRDIIIHNGFFTARPVE